MRTLFQPVYGNGLARGQIQRSPDCPAAARQRRGPTDRPTGPGDGRGSQGAVDSSPPTAIAWFPGPVSRAASRSRRRGGRKVSKFGGKKENGIPIRRIRLVGGPTKCGGIGRGSGIAPRQPVSRRRRERPTPLRVPRTVILAHS